MPETTTKVFENDPIQYTMYNCLLVCHCNYG